MDISLYAVNAESIDALSTYQITNFFHRQESITKDDCNHTAATIIGSPVSPTLVQGAGSYTVLCDITYPSKVVQFRDKPLNLDLLNQARQTYGKFVPTCTPRDMLADVYVYEMNCVPGVAFARVRRKLLAPEMESRLLQSVQDFARFFASAWIKRPDLGLPPDTASNLFAHYSSLLDKLSQGLPERFHPKLDEIRQGLPLLFRPGYPIVVNHDDLLESNIHVDEKTGRITGIVDWADAIFAPFGTSLGGLETLLGVQTSKQWHFYPSHKHLRKEFWKSFYAITGNLSADDRQAIEIGRMFGLFRTHGFDRLPEKDNAAALLEGDLGFICLEALCLKQAE